MKARAAFAALAAMFSPLPRESNLLAPRPLVIEAEQDGLVSPFAAARIRSAFSRFARFVGGG